MRLTTAISVALATISTASAQTERDLDSHDHGHAFLNIAVEGNSAFIELESPWNNLVGFEHAPSTDEQHAKVDEAMALLNQPGELFSFNGTVCTVSGTMIESTLGEDNHDEHHDEHDDDKHADGHDDEHHDEHDDDKHADGHKDEHHNDHDDDKHADGHDDEHHDEHDDDKHADGHDDEHHDEHDDDKHADGHDDEHHDEHDHDAEGATHSEVLASYTFECINIGDLQSIEVGLFNKMSGFEEMDVQIIGPGGQDATELTAEQFTIDISKVQ